MSVVEKYQSLGPKAVPASTEAAFIVDRIVFDSKHRSSPHRRYQVLDMAENLIGYARSMALAMNLLSLASRPTGYNPALRIAA